MGRRERGIVQELLRDLHLEDEPEAVSYLAVTLILLVCFACALVIGLSW